MWAASRVVWLLALALPFRWWGGGLGGPLLGQDGVQQLRAQVLLRGGLGFSLGFLRGVATEEVAEEVLGLLALGRLAALLLLAAGVAEGAVFIGHGIVLSAMGALDRLAAQGDLFGFHSDFLLPSFWSRAAGGKQGGRTAGNPHNSMYCTTRGGISSTGNSFRGDGARGPTCARAGRRPLSLSPLPLSPGEGQGKAWVTFPKNGGKFCRFSKGGGGGVWYHLVHRRLGPATWGRGPHPRWYGPFGQCLRSGLGAQRPGGPACPAGALLSL